MEHHGSPRGGGTCQVSALGPIGSLALLPTSYTGEGLSRICICIYVYIIFREFLDTNESNIFQSTKIIWPLCSERNWRLPKGFMSLKSAMQLFSSLNSLSHLPKQSAAAVFIKLPWKPAGNNALFVGGELFFFLLDVCYTEFSRGSSSSSSSMGSWDECGVDVTVCSW